MQESQLYYGLKQWHLIMMFAVGSIVPFSFFNAWWKNRKGLPFKSFDNILNRMALGFCHLQFLSGILLFTQSPKVRFENGALSDASTRYYSVIHELLMITAIVFITLSVIKVRKKPEEKKHATVVKFTGIAILIMLVSLLMLQYEMLRFF